MSEERKTVFVVDDDPDLGVLLTRLLETKYNVRYSSDPVSALTMLAQGPPPHLFLFDVMMPVLDGFALAKRVKAIPSLANVPLIFLTTRGGMKDVVSGINTGARHYVTKPFKAADLLAKIEKTLK